MTIYTWFIIACWGVFMIYWFISSLSVKKNLVGYSRGLALRLLVVLILVAVFRDQFLSGVRAYHLSSSSAPTLNLIGVILCGIGIGFAVWARAHLGKNWGMPMSVKENPELVTSGPYAYVRHPIYTGVLLAMIGTAFVTNLSWLIPFAFFSIYFIYSATREEKLMASRFPQQYPAYKQRTKMLIPFIF